MEHSRYIAIEKEIRKAKEGYATPFYWMGLILLIVVGGISVLNINVAQHDYNGIINLTHNMTYIASLQSNSTKLISTVVSLQSSVSSLSEIDYLALWLAVFLGAVFMFLIFSNIKPTPSGFKERMQERLKAKGYTEKEIQEYLKDKYDEIVWRRAG